MSIYKNCSFAAIFIFFLAAGQLQLFAQVHARYPSGQHFYEGGQSALTAEMINIAAKHNIPRCKNRKEVYSPSVLVYPDGKINLVKDEDSLTIAANKCAYNFSKALLPHLKGWMPAVVDGSRVKAIAKFTVQPFFISYSKLNPAENVFTPATFSDGLEVLNKKISLVLTNDILRNTDEPLAVVFLISDKGQLTDAALVYGGTDANSIHKAASKLKNIPGDWAPATMNSMPFEWVVIVPMDSRKKNFRYSRSPNFHWDNYRLFQKIR